MRRAFSTCRPSFLPWLRVREPPGAGLTAGPQVVDDGDAALRT